jgi:hypothetical protein
MTLTTLADVRELIKRQRAKSSCYILVYSGGGFLAPFAVLSVAVVISAGCMIALTREGF